MYSGRTLFAVVCVLAFMLAIAALSVPQLALGQMTIPTRTPVPDGGSPPDPEPEPKPTEDDGGDNDKPKPPPAEPQPSDTPEPSPSPVPPLPPPTAVPTLVPPTEIPIVATDTPTATSTATVPLPTATQTATEAAEIFVPEEMVATFPENNKPYPQASQCDMPPTFISLDTNNVYAGPGNAYPMVGLIGAKEARPIVGRAAFIDWWVIQLDGSGRAGWISDSLGDVHGYIGRVLIILAPDINGIAPTPGGNRWMPTPDANCRKSELFSGVVVYYVDDTDEAPPSGSPDMPEGLLDSSRGEEGDHPLSQTAAPSDVRDTASTGRKAVADPLLAELADSAPPFEIPGVPSSRWPNLLPVAGIILILAAVIIGLFARRN